jgi:hypothetical protein
MVKLSDKIKSRIQQLSLRQNDLQSKKRFQTWWNLLAEDEQSLLQFINGDSRKTENTIVANMLYVLNNEIEKDLYNILKQLGLPESSISKAAMEAFLPTVTNEPGYVEMDGILCQNSPYASLDPCWIELFISYVYFQEYPEKIASFGNTPSVRSLNNNNPVSIAIMGDWGTGEYDDFGFPSPSSLMGKAIKNLNPDITVHLGDTYYAGSEEQVTKKLLADFPSGSIANYTMNGNHEMFDGANGYFKTALSHPVFIKQQHTSYFAILYNDWVITGLDTAYFDQSIFHLEGALNDENQLAFIKSLHIKDHQKIILLTHHAALLIDGSAIIEPLFSQVYKAFGNRYPDYWYYGHKHNGVVYNNASAQGAYKCNSGLSPQLRCFGHGSIPIGNAVGLHDGKGNKIEDVDYYASTAMPNPDNIAGLRNRVLNGFVILTLSDNKIVEQVYEVSTDRGAIPVWSNVVN